MLKPLGIVCRSENKWEYVEVLMFHILNWCERFICTGQIKNGAWLSYSLQDEKDLKIRELSTELHRERKRSAAYQEQLQMVLKYVEEHTQRLSLNAQAGFNRVRQIESEEQDDLDSD